MKKLSYCLIGAFIGLLLGMFFGLMLGSEITKKSQREAKAKIQMVIFGAVGTVIGFSFGAKLAQEDAEIKRKEEAYRQSLRESKCLYCNNSFQYSILDVKEKRYCDPCFNRIYYDYTTQCREINKIAEGIELLKRKHAIRNRLTKINAIAEDLLIYEDVDLHFITKKPSEIIKNCNERLQELG